MFRDSQLEHVYCLDEQINHWYHSQLNLILDVCFHNSSSSFKDVLNVRQQNTAAFCMLQSFMLWPVVIISALFQRNYVLFKYNNTHESCKVGGAILARIKSPINSIHRQCYVTHS